MVKIAPFGSKAGLVIHRKSRRNAPKSNAFKGTPASATTQCQARRYVSRAHLVALLALSAKERANRQKKTPMDMISIAA